MRLPYLAPESEDVATILNDLGEVEQASGDYPAAERHYGEALEMAKQFNGQEAVAAITGNLAELALDQEDWPAAEQLAREALPLSEALGRKEIVASQCRRLAKALRRQDRSAEGLTHAQRAVEIFTRLRAQELEEAQKVLEECEVHG